jgi:hypothetical protein
VKYVFDQLGIPLPGKTQAYEATMSFTAQRFGTSTEQYVRANYPLTTIEQILADSVNKFNNVIDAAPFSNYSRDKLRDLVSILTDTTGENAAYYTDIKGRIVNWETGVQNDQNISSQEKTYLLRVSSIARYSILYWYREFTRCDPNVQPSQRKRKWWQWLIVGICDVAGGIAGATVNAGVAVSAGAAASVAAATIINWGASE